MRHERPQAVFWDVDGTLILTEGLHYEVIRDWCAGRGYEREDADRFAWSPVVGQ